MLSTDRILADGLWGRAARPQKHEAQSPSLWLLPGPGLFVFVGRCLSLEFQREDTTHSDATRCVSLLLRPRSTTTHAAPDQSERTAINEQINNANGWGTGQCPRKPRHHLDDDRHRQGDKKGSSERDEIQAQKRRGFAPRAQCFCGSWRGKIF